MTGTAPRPRVLVVVGGRRADLVEGLERLRSRLSGLPAGDAVPSAMAAAGPLGDAPHRLVVVASSCGEALARLASAAKGVADPSVQRIHNPTGIYYFGEPLGRGGKVAFLFPGDGAQYPGMLARLRPFLERSRWMGLVERGLAGHEVQAAESARLPPDEAAWVVMAVSRTFSQFLGELGAAPDLVAGHSFGELGALLATGYLPFETDGEFLEAMAVLRRLQSQARQEGQRLKAASVSVVAPDPRVIEAVLARYAGRLFLASDNCPHQVTLAGYEDAVAQAIAELTKQGAICERLPEPMAPHTPLVEALVDPLSRAAAALRVQLPTPVAYSGTIAAPFPRDREEVRRLTARQWIEPVQFRKTLEAMHRDGARVFIDVGPRGVLAGFVDDTLRGKPHASAAMNLEGRPADEQLCQAVALLAAHHLPLDLGALDAAVVSLAPVTAPAPAHHPSAPSPLPFIRQVQSLDPGRGLLIAKCELDIQEDLFLFSHAFGGRVSNSDPTLTSLSIVPFVVSLEMMAEAAVTLAPDRFVVGLRDVQVHHWMAPDLEGKLALRLSATKQSGRVKVEIRRDSDPGAEPLAEGTVLLAMSPPEPRPAEARPSTPYAKARSTAGDYQGPHQRNFQGPLFQPLRQILRADASGAEAVLATPPREAFFRTRSAAGLVLDPQLLEGVAQTTSYSLQGRFERWVSILPFGLEALDLHGPGVPPGAEVRCRVTNRSADAPVGICDASLVSLDGRLLASLRGWSDWCVFLPPRFRAFGFNPLETFLSAPVEGAPPGARTLPAFDAGFMESMDGFWQRVLREAVLSAVERRAWPSWGASEPERLERLMERIVVKDAVRSLLRARSGAIWGSADIDLGPQPSVPARVRGEWGSVRASVSRTSGAWVAIVREDEDERAV